MSFEWLTESGDAPRSPSVDGAAFFQQLSGNREKTAKVHPRVWLDTAAGAAIGGIPTYLAARKTGKDNKNSLARTVDSAASALGGPTPGTERDRRFAELVGDHPVISGLVGALLGGSAARYSAGKRIAASTHVPDKKVLGDTGSVDFSKTKKASLETWLEDQTREELAAAAKQTGIIKLGWYLEGLSENELLSLDHEYAQADEREKVAIIGRVLGGLSRLAGSRFGAARSVGGWAAGKGAQRAVARSGVHLPRIKDIDSELGRLRGMTSGPAGDVAQKRVAQLSKERAGLASKTTATVDQAEVLAARARVAGKAPSAVPVAKGRTLGDRVTKTRKNPKNLSPTFDEQMAAARRGTNHLRPPPIPATARSAPAPQAPPKTAVPAGSPAPKPVPPKPVPPKPVPPKPVPPKPVLTSTRTGNKFGAGKARFKTKSAPTSNGFTRKAPPRKVLGSKPEIPGATSKAFKRSFTAPAQSIGGVLGRAKSKKWRVWAGKNPGTAIKHTASKLAGPAAYGTAGYMAANSLLSGPQDREVTAAAKDASTAELGRELARRALTKKLVTPTALISGGFMLGRMFPKKEPQQDMQMY